LCPIDVIAATTMVDPHVAAGLGAGPVAHHRHGSWPTRDLWEFVDYVEGSGGTSHDAVIGSIGGGNHFLEIQCVDACIAGALAGFGA
jgi:RNA-splicing ligase RtcB